jgi:DNA replication initiation complex subunit (GINS family)
MKKQLINEAFRFQRLAGIITENEYMEKNTSIYESSLSPEEKKVYDDIVNTLNENNDNIIDIIKSYAKKGLITIGILTALLTGSQITQNQKDQVIDTVETEMSTDQDFQDYLIGAKAYSVAQSPVFKEEVAKLAKEDFGVQELLKYELKNWNKLSRDEQINVGKNHKDECQKLIDIQNNLYTSTAQR